MERAGQPLSGRHAPPESAWGKPPALGLAPVPITGYTGRRPLTDPSSSPRSPATMRRATPPPMPTPSDGVAPMATSHGPHLPQDSSRKMRGGVRPIAAGINRCGMLAPKPSSRALGNAAPARMPSRLVIPPQHGSGAGQETDGNRWLPHRRALRWLAPSQERQGACAIAAAGSRSASIRSAVPCTRPASRRQAAAPTVTRRLLVGDMPSRFDYASALVGRHKQGVRPVRNPPP